MPSQPDPRLCLLATAALLTAALSLAAAPRPRESVQAQSESPGDAEIAHALETVRADPNLAGQRTIKTLRWKGSTEPTRSAMPAWLTWVVGLIRWVEQSARVLIWVAAVALAGVLVMYIVRTVRAHGGAPRGGESFVAPTHVRDLDIRPETLPQDIGAAARELWDRGERRASLALLYRGMLSRLAHVYRIPIRDSSTEGDCLALSSSHLARARYEYASRLVLVWQRAVYGREDVQSAIVYLLCDDFASALDAPLPLDAIAPGGAA